MNEELEKIAEQIRVCEKCPLAEGRLYAVPGSGSGKSGIVFIGEGPGAREDKLGEPFVGAAGKFLDEMLTDVGLKREDVFITNIVKCRPPNNRDPLPDCYFDPFFDLITVKQGPCSSVSQVSLIVGDLMTIAGYFCCTFGDSNGQFVPKGYLLEYSPYVMVTIRPFSKNIKP